MIYGWDISTAIVGLALFDDDGQFKDYRFCDLRKSEGQIQKADTFKCWLSNLKVNTTPTNYHFVEERLGGFSAGRSSAQVMMKLAQFNAICSYILWDWESGSDPGFHSGNHRQIAFIHPSTWKAVMKKEGLLIPKGADKKSLTLAFVKRKVPTLEVELNRNDKPQPWMYDIADAYCIGRAGYLKCIASANSQP
jgi:hypothetical protein